MASTLFADPPNATMDEAKEHFMAAEQVNTKQSPNRKGMEKSKQKRDRKVPKENGQKIPTKEGIEKLG